MDLKNEYNNHERQRHQRSNQQREDVECGVPAHDQSSTFGNPTPSPSLTKRPGGQDGIVARQALAKPNF